MAFLFISRILLLYLAMGPSHILDPAAGPMWNPSSLARGWTLKERHCGKCVAIHLVILAWTSLVNLHKETKTHFIGFKARPPRSLQSQYIGWISCRCLRFLRVMPISSAQALTIPGLCSRRMSSKFVRNGSMALLNKRADARHPCRTPEAKFSRVFDFPLCVYIAQACLYTLWKTVCNQDAFFYVAAPAKSMHRWLIQRLLQSQMLQL